MSESNHRDVPAFPQPSHGTGENGAGGFSAGCQRPVALGCGCLVLSVVIGFGLLASRSDDLVRFYVAGLRAPIEAALPEALGQDERQRLDQAFAGFTRALIEEPPVLRELWEVQKVIQETVQNSKQRELTLEEVETLTEALERAGARREPGELEPREPSSLRTIARGLARPAGRFALLSGVDPARTTTRGTSEMASERNAGREW